MSRANTNRPKTGLRPSIAILVFVIAYLGSGYLTLDDTTRFVPLMAGGVTLLLLVIDMLRTAFARGGVVGTNDEDTASAPPGRELKAIGYVAGAVATIYLLGFSVAIPVYLFTSIAYLGKQSIRTALTVALLTSLAIYLIFEVLLAYKLYPGMLFA